MSLGELANQITGAFEEVVQSAVEMTPNGLIMRTPSQEQNAAFKIDGLEPSPMDCLICDFPSALCKCPPPPPPQEDPLFESAPEVLNQFAHVMTGLLPTANTQQNPNAPATGMSAGSPSGMSGGPSGGAPGGPG